MNKKAELAVAAFCAMFAILSMSALQVQPASAAPTVPETIPNGLPVNLMWRGHAYAAIVGSSLREAGWALGGEVQSIGAYYTLTKDDGDLACWCLWIYDGGARDSEWGYWSYATVAHYHWSYGWILDDLEGSKWKICEELTELVLPWNVQFDYYFMNNKGTYDGVYNAGFALRFMYSEEVSGEGATEWTTNPTFDLRDSADLDWDRLNLVWDFGGGTGSVNIVPNDDNHYVTWPGNRHVEISADDDTPLDDSGESARITYGSQDIEGHEYPYTDPAYRLTVSGLDKLTVKAVVAMWEAGLAFPPSWTGIKFDAWFADPLEDGRRMMIEMYFARSGLNLNWAGSEIADIFMGSETIYASPDGNELARTLPVVGGSVDDYMINLYAFTEANIIGDYQIATFVIDLKAIWNRAQDRFGRSNSDQLYAIAMDAESAYVTWRAWAAASEIKVTYTDPTPPSNPTGWSSSHTPNVWSTDNTVDISWWGAADSESGVYGYSYLWDNSATTIPDTQVDTTATNTVSSTLASGAWYFHVRTRDNAGNWASGALHVGPFRIDTAPPSTPSLLFPYSAVTFTDSQPTFTWNTAADSNSGVQSYTLQLDTTTSFNSGNLRTYTGITATSYEVPTALLRTTWYWRVRAVDNVGNTGTYSSARSIKIDKIKTQLSVSVNPSTIKYQRTTTISGMLIPTTEIIIESTAVGDTYFRYHGMAFDESLPINFWIDKPSSIIGTSSSFFYYVRQANLTAGAHYVTYAVSSYVGHWNVKIYINGVLTGEGDTDVHNHFMVNFYVSGFGSQQVSLSYSNDNGATWSSITTVTTTSTGQYSYVWRPPKKGNYIIKASYSGNSNCYGSSSTTNLTVT